MVSTRPRYNVVHAHHQHRVPLRLRACWCGRVPAAVDFIQRARVRADGRVLVHCNEGKSRSVAIAAAYLMKAYGKSAEDALDALRAARPQADPREAFCRQLATLEPQTLAAPIDGFQGSETGTRAGDSVGAATGPAVGPTARPGVPRRAEAGPTMPPAKRVALGPNRPGDAKPSVGPRVMGPSVGPSDDAKP